MSLSEHHHHIHYIEFTAPDLNAIESFYGSVFGWQFQDWDPDNISFERAGVAGDSSAARRCAAPALWWSCSPRTWKRPKPLCARPGRRS